jgi:hypothetical protein
MGKKVRRLGVLAVAAAVLVGSQIGVSPSAAAPGTDHLDMQWLTQVSDSRASDSITQIFPTLDAGLLHVQIRSNFKTATAETDVERFQILNPAAVTPADVDTQLALATSGDPVKAKLAMQWFKDNTRFYSGSAATGPAADQPNHMRFKIVQEAGTYYVAQITPGRVAATAKKFVVRPRVSADTLPGTSQTLKMEPNNTFSVTPGGTIPIIRQIPLRVENNDDELHFAKFLPVPSTTTPTQAANWCGTGSGLTPGSPVFGIGTMSGGVKTVVETFTIPVGKYIVADFLPNSQTGQSNIATMCKLVRVTA